MIEHVKKFSMLLLTIIIMPLITFSLPFSFVHAEEITENESETDSYQNERLNNLEIRLQEMGYVINDLQMSIENIQEELEMNAEQRLYIGQQLDLVIIGLRDLCNYNIELLSKSELKEISDHNYQESVINALTLNEKYMVLLNKNTVSGNSLIGTFNKNFKEDLKSTSEISLQEFNETMENTNQLLSYLFVLLVFIMVTMLCILIGTLIHNITKKFVI